MVQVNIASNLQKVLADVRNYGKEVQDAVKKELSLSGLRVQRNAKSACPVKTGRLRASIKLKTQNDGYTITVGTEVEYAIYVEFGTRRMTARPFLFPAAERDRPQLETKLMGALRRAGG